MAFLIRKIQSNQAKEKKIIEKAENVAWRMPNSRMNMVFWAQFPVPVFVIGFASFIKRHLEKQNILTNFIVRKRADWAPNTEYIKPE